MGGDGETTRREAGEAEVEAMRVRMVRFRSCTPRTSAESSEKGRDALKRRGSRGASATRRCKEEKGEERSTTYQNKSFDVEAEWLSAEVDPDALVGRP